MKPSRVFLLPVLLGSLLLLNVGPAVAEKRVVADTIYRNGTILTLNESNDVAEAVAVKDGKILAVGKHRDMRKHYGHGTRTVSLRGKTLMPGFYDAHSHFVFEGIVSLFNVNLNSPPIGPINDIPELVQVLQDKAAEIPDGTWIQGSGYDDTLLAERRHPTREDLDDVSTTHPIFITHVSGHLAVANSLALELAGVDANSAQPPGGVIRKYANGEGLPAYEDGEPSGILEEAPATSIVSGLIPPQTFADILAAIAKAAQTYSEQGVTTANSGASSLGLALALKQAANDGSLPIRVNLWPTLEQADAVYALDFGTDKLSVGGIKEFADGSIQGYTGYLGEPYFVQPAGETDYRGFPRHEREVLADRIMQIHKAGRHAYVHGNGDAAIDDILYGFRKAQEAFPRADTRHVVIHSQMAREDQLDEMARLGVIPSFFVLHTYYWGDRHRDIFMGPERAFRMSPTASAAARGIRFTIHNDTPVVPMDPLLSVWAAVNRISTGGQVIGSEQAISALQALRATTIDAAYQNFEEDTKGSIEVGKFADFALLSDNPMEVEPVEIRDIRVLMTVVGGDTVFKAPWRVWWHPPRERRQRHSH